MYPCHVSIEQFDPRGVPLSDHSCQQFFTAASGLTSGVIIRNPGHPLNNLDEVFCKNVLLQIIFTGFLDRGYGKYKLFVKHRKTWCKTNRSGR